jgi:hypothetical protein
VTGLASLALIVGYGLCLRAHKFAEPALFRPLGPQLSVVPGIGLIVLPTCVDLAPCGRPA